MASQDPSNISSVSPLDGPTEVSPNHPEEESPPPSPPTPTPGFTLTNAQIERLRARARIMSYELQSPLQAPQAPNGSPSRSCTSLSSVSPDSSRPNSPHSSASSQDNNFHEQVPIADVILANLRLNRQNLRGIILIYIGFFPGDNPDGLLTTLGVHTTRNTIPGIRVATHLLNVILRETEWLEIDLLGDDPLQLRNFRQTENRRMGREIRTLRSLIDSYVEIKEELGRRHGIFLSPVDLPSHFEDDDENHENWDDYPDEDEDEEMTEDDNDEQSTESDHDEGSSESTDEDQTEESLQDPQFQIIIETRTGSPECSSEALPGPAEKATTTAEKVTADPLLRRERSEPNCLEVALPYFATLVVGIAVAMHKKKSPHLS
ncbi:hypothetical protein TWF718_003814 [Orbilia javanica]|uniref:Uncharacterized protein n=1 Tax=Orbilia javanica TaxID=47235 RepID=A0AAN8MWR3_9PEZI